MRSQNTVPVQGRALNNCKTAPLQLCTLTTTLTDNALSHFLFTAPVNAHLSIIQRVNYVVDKDKKESMFRGDPDGDFLQSNG